MFNKTAIVTMTKQTCGTVLAIPSLDQRNIDGASCAAGTNVERSRRPHEGNAVGRVLRVKRNVVEDGHHRRRQLPLLVVVVEHGLKALQTHK